MSLLTVEKVTHGFGARQILEDASFRLLKGEHIGLIGANGEGKSTFLNIITGKILPDAGKITWSRHVTVGYLDQHTVLKKGMTIREVLHTAFNHMHDLEAEMLKLYEDMALPENADKMDEMMEDAGEIQQILEYSGFYQLDAKIEEVAGGLGLRDIGLDRDVSDLSGGQRTKVLLVKLLLENPSILILDEPTSSLDDKEVQKLFGLMKDLKARGVGIIFVTHFLDQVYEVCDRITVLRDGKLVGEYEIEKLPRVQLVAKMLGKELDDEAQIKDETQIYHADESVPPVFEVEQLQSNAGIKPFDFYIRKGEVNGFTGLLGSGRSECVRAIFGADRVIGGKIKKNGKEIKISKPIDAMKNGIAYLPEDRKVDGIVGDLSVRDNIILAAQVLRGFFRPFSKAQANKFADEYIDMLQIKTASRETPIKSLSGGNQQKVILGRWLLTNPEYLILDEPTRGIDIETKIEIQKLVLKLASEGMSVTFISSETDEMLRTCSRLIVMRDRKKVGEITGEDLTQSKIMDTIAGGDEKNA